MKVTDAFSDESRLRRAIERSNQYPIPSKILLRVCIGELSRGSRIERLYREIELLAPLLARDRSISRVQWVGTAVVSLRAERRTELLQCLAQHFAIAEAAIAQLAGSPARSDGPAPLPCDVLGLGPGAVSEFDGVRATNFEDAEQYCAALDLGLLPVARAEAVGATY
jgi:hypothetical protein